MADEEKLNFDDAPKASNGAADARREAAKVTIGPRGAVRSNTEGKDSIIDHVIRQGGDPNNFELTYRANQDAGKVALYLSKPGDTGVMKVTIYSHAVTFHLGSCFKYYPKLRPATKVDCRFVEDVDAKGNPCLIVNVAAGTETRAVKRKKKGDKKAQNKPPGDAPDKQDPQDPQDSQSA